MFYVLVSVSTIRSTAVSTSLAFSHFFPPLCHSVFPVRLFFNPFFFLFPLFNLSHSLNFCLFSSLYVHHMEASSLRMYVVVLLSEQVITSLFVYPPRPESHDAPMFQLHFSAHTKLIFYASYNRLMQSPNHPRFLLNAASSMLPLSRWKHPPTQTHTEGVTSTKSGGCRDTTPPQWFGLFYV